MSKRVTVTLSAYLVLALTLGTLLAFTGCSNNTSDKENLYTFGLEDTGYMSSPEKFEFDSVQSMIVSIYNFYGVDNNAYAGFMNLSSLMSMFGGDSQSITDEQKQSLVEQYTNQEGIESSEFTTNAGISGLLLKASGDNIEEAMKSYDIDNNRLSNVANPVFYIFITDDLHSVFVYSDEELAIELIGSYSYTGDPTDPISEEEIEEKSKALELNLGDAEFQPAEGVEEVETTE